MKLKTLIFTVLLGSLLTGCEERIDADNRYTPASTHEYRRSVLIEEYTGSKCVNCPYGHEILESLEAFYNTEENIDRDIELIVVGIHIPNWGYDLSVGGLVTPEAADLSPSGITPPQAQVNRSGAILDRDDWAKVIDEQMSRQPEVTFPNRVSATVDSVGIKMKGSVITDSNISDARLHVWVVEDSITFRQLMPDGSRNDNYVHQNVYRAHLNESYAGDDFPLTRNTEKEFAYTYPVHKNWNTDNLRIVVFLETPIKGVLNATQSPILPL